METLVPLFAITGFFASVIVVAYLFFNSRHKIRMALIQHNKDAGIFKEDRDASTSLKYGMVAVGLGFGLFAGGMMEWAGIGGPPAYLGMMLILGGAGLILYYVFIRKKSGGGDEIV